MSLSVKLGDLGVFRDAAGKIHEDAEVCHVWAASGPVNVVFTEGGTRYADCNVPVRGREERQAPGRFFEKGEQDD